MRTIERTGQFKRDWKREIRGRHSDSLATDFIEIIEALADDRPLAKRHRDHALTGDWKRPSGLPCEA